MYIIEQLKNQLIYIAKPDYKLDYIVISTKYKIIQLQSGKYLKGYIMLFASFIKKLFLWIASSISLSIFIYLIYNLINIKLVDKFKIFFGLKQLQKILQKCFLQIVKKWTRKKIAQRFILFIILDQLSFVDFLLIEKLISLI